MIFESALYSYLTNHAGLSMLVGNRIYPLKLPQEPILPAVVYTRVSTQRVVAHDGRLDLADARFQLDAWGDSYGSTKEVAERLRVALLAFGGAMDGVRVSITTQETEIDLWEEQTGRYRVSTDYRIWHSDGEQHQQQEFITTSPHEQTLITYGNISTYPVVVLENRGETAISGFTLKRYKEER